MTEHNPERASGGPSAAGRAAVSGRVPNAGRLGARLAFVVTVAVLGAGLAAAWRSEGPATEARVGRSIELIELIRAEQSRTDALAARVEELSAQVAEYERADAGGPASLDALQAEVERLAAPAGLSPLRGTGLVTTLTDSPLRESPSGDVNDLVIHEQDLQSVINALWSGGAEAMTVNGQRVVATTAIRCVGNTLLLHGRVYSPPYVIAAVGDPVAMRDALDRDPGVAQFRDAVKQFKVGMDVAEDDDMSMPAHEGLVTMQVARPVQEGR